MLKHLDLTKILFLDIETVPQTEDYESLDEEWKDLWLRKAAFIAPSQEENDPKYERAGIYAEFGKVICISLGVFDLKTSKRKFRIKTLSGHNEASILEEFIRIANHFYKSSDHLLCAHNGKEFDFPYLARRILVNGLTLPHLLDIAGRKPWEVQHLDTMQLWKFGDYKHYTSLKLLCKLFQIPSPKSDMEGSQVAEVYYKEKDLERIESYCREDTLAVAQLLLKFMGEKILSKKEVVLV